MNEIQDQLARWFEAHKRVLPWRSEPSPYHVWLSEIILQQTRVNQGLDYYSRARNLHTCAREVMERHGGAFPADYAQLRQLKGVGDYTAAAIASIAFDLPHAVVDGNVYRVLSRLYDIDTPINKQEGAKLFAALADELLDRKHPGRHNQALMEFGALHCLPSNPDCPQRPVKEKRLQVKTRHFHYLVLHSSDHHVYLHKRGPNDIWQNLYDFPCIETDQPIEIEDLLSHPTLLALTSEKKFSIGQISHKYTHKLTHQTIIAQFFEIKIDGFLSPIQTKDILLAPENDLGGFPVPKLIENYLNQQ